MALGSAVDLLPEQAQRQVRVWLGEHGYWHIAFCSGDRAWEMEVPSSATAGLQVRVHLVESGSHRGMEASARLSWRVYREVVATLERGSGSPGEHGARGHALSTVLREGFGPMVMALCASPRT